MQANDATERSAEVKQLIIVEFQTCDWPAYGSHTQCNIRTVHWEAFTDANQAAKVMSQKGRKLEDCLDCVDRNGTLDYDGPCWRMKVSRRPCNATTVPPLSICYKTFVSDALKLTK